MHLANRQRFTVRKENNTRLQRGDGRPPSTRSTCPVINPAKRGLARKTAAAATSIDEPSRRIGVRVTAAETADSGIPVCQTGQTKRRVSRKQENGVKKSHTKNHVSSNFSRFTCCHISFNEARLKKVYSDVSRAKFLGQRLCETLGQQGTLF